MSRDLARRERRLFSGCRSIFRVILGSEGSIFQCFHRGENV